MFPMYLRVEVFSVIWVMMDVTEVVGLGWFRWVFVVVVLNDSP